MCGPFSSFSGDEASAAVSQALPDNFEVAPPNLAKQRLRKPDELLRLLREFFGPGGVYTMHEKWVRGVKLATSRRIKLRRQLPQDE